MTHPLTAVTTASATGPPTFLASIVIVWYPPQIAHPCLLVGRASGSILWRVAIGRRARLRLLRNREDLTEKQSRRGGTR
ncbi:hypothetical protein JCM4814A_93230 [Streptomyces phaeofaciens JCM 4814]|uniref:Uncharacterized protein n=1 Tax=Streptomyces phaeofaciens TaxID=68254 RepID=A0A918HJL3_9ACTN|nr:hypothetical protein GCM10010226_56570 [Streptomyces phaeofaciens]